MPTRSKVYYLVKGKRPKKKTKERKDGIYRRIVDVARDDPLRKEMLEKLKDQDYRENVLGIHDVSTEDAIHDYQERLNSFVHPSDKEMCVDLYALGEEVKSGMDDPKREDSEILVRTKGGKEVWFDREDKVSETVEVCTYDKQHDGPLEDLPEDVSNVAGFGVAALLIVIRRTFIEKLQQYTYVGDVVIAVNPYHFFPKMIKIQQPPEVKNYRFGEEPTVYATAHFSYWGLMDPERYFHDCPRNQSCIVSGESGAGKTVSCGQIMKYLANMSDWSRGLRRRESSGNPLVGTKTNGTVDVTKLVGGVSPFLEAFGNANTVMNDNSSRFGKFMKILFDRKGAIVGGEVDHYLLEKGRLSYQGKEERNFHIFYFLLKGATPEERKSLRLKNAQEYGMLFGGGRTTIKHEDRKRRDGTIVNTYDEDRMNWPLRDNPDKTGCRAALTAAGVDEKRQSEMWRVLAALLKLGDLQFVAGKDENSSKVKNVALLKEIESLLGLDHLDEAERLGRMLCIYRRIIDGKTYDSPVNPTVASFQRFAFIKDTYARVFDELMRVVNRVLDPHTGSEGFIGILDIFGFEVFEYNSMEQLCINFANEKLQKLFNEHIFVEEGKIYKKEELPLDVLPPFRDNTPCCDLIEKRHVGIFPMLDDLSGKRNASDEKYARAVFAKYGYKSKAGKDAASKAERMAAQYIHGREIDPMYFVIRHFAGDVRYHTKNWLEKNEDKLPSQIPSLMKQSSSVYVSEYVYMKNGLPAEDRDRDDRRKKRKPRKNTIACKFITSLGELASTLKKTNPHYVRCVKPNDVHMRPCDGRISFDASKVYRQLLYAGVMEVCKIKKEGYPFRESYERFWTHRCVGNKWINLMVPSLSKDLNPKEGVKRMCEAIMPAPRLQGQKPHQVVRPTWVPGKTMLFGKDYTLETFDRWHKLQLAGMMERWTRLHVVKRAKLRDFVRACGQIQNRYRRVLEARRFACFEVQMIRAQGMLKSLKARAVYATRRDRHRSSQIVQRAYRNFWRWSGWSRVAYQLERVELVREAATRVQLAWSNFRSARVWATALRAARKRDALVRIVRAHRRYRVYVDWFVCKERVRKFDACGRVVRAWRGYRAHVAYASVRAALVRRGSERLLDVMANECAKALALVNVRRSLRARLRRMRGVLRTQKHLRGRVARRLFVRLRNEYATMKRAEMRAEGLWRMQAQRRELFARVRGMEIATRFFETIQMRSWINSRIEAILIIQRFFRSVRRRTFVREKVGAAMIVQDAVRFRRMMRRVRARRDAIGILERFFYHKMMSIRLTEWIEQMQQVCAAGDVDGMKNMMSCRSPYRRLGTLRHERVPERGGGNGRLVEYNALVNLRDRVFLTSFLHTAVNSGSIEAAQYLVRQGADPESLDVRRNTPVHLAAADGDRSLSTLQLLLRSCRTPSRANERVLWVLSHEGTNVHNVTVLDKAIECDGPHDRTVSYLRTREARFHSDVKKKCDTIERFKRHREIVEETDLMRTESKIARVRAAAASFKYATLDPQARDRRTERLNKSPSQIAADQKITTMFTIAKAKARFKRLRRRGRKRSDVGASRASMDSYRSSMGISSVHEERERADLRRKLHASTMDRVHSFRQRMIERNEQRTRSLRDLDSKIATASPAKPVEDGRGRTETLKGDRNRLAMWSAIQKSAEIDRSMVELDRHLIEKSPHRGSVVVESISNFLDLPESSNESADLNVTDAKAEEEEEEEEQRLQSVLNLENQKRDVMKKQLDRLRTLSESTVSERTSSLAHARRWLLRASMALDRISSRNAKDYKAWGWEYLDANGTIYGPFSTSRMREWFEKGYFSSHLPVRYTSQDNRPFVGISELFIDTDDAFRAGKSPLSELGTARLEIWNLVGR